MCICPFIFVVMWCLSSRAVEARLPSLSCLLACILPHRPTHSLCIYAFLRLWVDGGGHDHLPMQTRSCTSKTTARAPPAFRSLAQSLHVTTPTPEKSPRLLLPFTIRREACLHSIQTMSKAAIMGSGGAIFDREDVDRIMRRSFHPLEETAASIAAVTCIHLYLILRLIPALMHALPPPAMVALEIRPQRAGCLRRPPPPTNPCRTTCSWQSPRSVPACVGRAHQPRGDASVPALSAARAA